MRFDRLLLSVLVLIASGITLQKLDQIYFGLASGDIRDAKKKEKIFAVSVSAFTSCECETDDTPFVTASNKRVRHGIAAANFLPLGTKIRILNPAVSEILGTEILVIEDRMNPRYNDSLIVDVWMLDREDAKRFGRKKTLIEILD